MSEEYRVQLDVFSGPLDLLLYLIRRDELDIQDILIARVTEQYLSYVKLLETLDPNTAGDFLVLACTLVELKSRALLPTPPLEGMDAEEDPGAVLVRQLLEYKRFKDAARALGSAADDRRQRFVRQPAELPPDLQGVELEEVQVWDLLRAYGRVMTAIGQGPGLHQVTYDETPIETYKLSIVETLERAGPVNFRSMFSSRATRAEIVGLFLALLELIRSQKVRAEQDRAAGEIFLFMQIEIEEPAEVAGEPDADDSAVAIEAATRVSDESDPPVSAETNGLTHESLHSHANGNGAASAEITPPGANRLRGLEDPE